MLSDRVSASEGMLTSQGNLLTMLKGSLSSGSLIGNGGMESDLSLWVDSGTGSGFTYNDAEKALNNYSLHPDGKHHESTRRGRDRLDA